MGTTLLCVNITCWGIRIGWQSMARRLASAREKSQDREAIL